MILSYILKLKIYTFIMLSTQSLGQTVTNQLPENLSGTKEVFLQGGGNLQGYYVPYQKYFPAPENQIQTALSSTEKTISSAGYKIPLSTNKYEFSQALKQTQSAQGSQVSYPYLYTLAITPSTTPKYSVVSSTSNDFYKDVPKKYHYGYRVSNPHTGAEFGHSEVNDGITARGYYHVLLPDGRLQNVKYWAGPSGYHATITYESQY